MSDTYTHGHHESVLENHRWRTAANSAGYLLSYLEAGQSILDVGCGPGTITIDFARLVSPGAVIGIDTSDAVVAEATTAAREAGVSNVEFAVGDTYRLEYEDERFDVVHAHQVLQHLSDPVGALEQMHRVLRRGGILAVRDSDYRSFIWSPPFPALDRWLELHHQVTSRNGADCDAGRSILHWVREAGFRDATYTTSTWTFADPTSRQWWSRTWAGRVVNSAFATQAIEYDLTDEDELAEIATAWHDWAASPDAIFVLVHGEVIARR